MTSFAGVGPSGSSAPSAAVTSATEARGGTGRVARVSSQRLAWRFAWSSALYRSVMPPVSAVRGGRVTVVLPGFQPVRGALGRGPGKPGVLDYFLELFASDRFQVALSYQHRVVAVEVVGGEERGVGVACQGLLVGLRFDPDDDDVVVAFAGYRVLRVGAGVAEEDEGLAADLVDRLALRAVDPGDVRHRLG